MIRRYRRSLLAMSGIALVALLAWTGMRLWPAQPLAAQISSSTALFDRQGRLLRLTLADDHQYRLWTPLDEVSPEFIDALLLHEDQHFYSHPGVNPAAIVRATVSTYTGGARVGGSTITMQLARLLYGLNTRSISGKVRQIGHALWLDARYSKRDILEAHINLMPYGGNIQGVGAASLIYFDKSAERLTLPESLALVLIPQSPMRRAPTDSNVAAPATTQTITPHSSATSHQLDTALSASNAAASAPIIASLASRATHDDGDPTRPGRALAASQDQLIEPVNLHTARLRLFERWQEQHPASLEDHEYVTAPLAFSSRRALPFAAPHFTNQILQSPRPANQHSIDTTLDLRLQQALERVMSTFVSEHRAIGINNAAALLVDYRDMSVRALLGSSDFFSADISGQVSAIQAKRSPGSTLKPLIYALAMDQGLIHPMSVLKDAPTRFGPFSPENFDGRFVGPITAQDALTRSRNVPAMTLSAQLNEPNLYQFLRNAGISRMASERHYGLALTLGGGEVTMAETAALYAMLANRGELRPLRYLQDSLQQPGRRLLSEEASFMALDMLRSAPRPDAPQVRRRNQAPVAWKTGTSWAFRDAWTAGVFGPYVLVVWVGNFDGSGNPAFVGVQAAAPLFFRMVDAVASQGRLVEPALRQPPRLARVEVCSASGDLPNAECPQLSETWYIPGVSPIKISQIHRRVWIDTRTGEQACPPYDPRHTRSEVYEFWPSDLLQLFSQAGMPRRRPPSPIQCQLDAPSGTAPRIVSPLLAVSYAIPTAQIGQQTIGLAANTDSEVRRLHWFVNDSFVGTAAPEQSINWQPMQAGHYIVRAVDDRGRADTREVAIELIQ